MGDYHEVFLAVDLRLDLPEPVLAGLRRRVGLTDTAPTDHLKPEPPPQRSSK